MILCMCRGVSDRRVLDAIRSGARTLEDVAARCEGAGGDCGTCRDQLAELLAAHSAPAHAA